MRLNYGNIPATGCLFEQKQAGREEVVSGGNMFRSDPDDPNSWSSKARARRCRLFVECMQRAGVKQASILDIGGTVEYWRMNARFIPEGLIRRVEVVNLPPIQESRHVINGIEVVGYEGNALDSSTLRQEHYDVVFSNSVIEHVGNLRAQLHMATIVRGRGDYYFVQTPAKSFPIEPHFYFPFFPYLPLSWRTWLHKHLPLGFMGRNDDWLSARMACEETRLLTESEFQAIFKGGRLLKERVLGLCKSYMMTNLG
jgi:hypothetical protein